MTTATTHEVKTAASVLADDVICQSFIQSSSTLAYACLLIRRAKYDLASHVLHSLEAKQASRFKDMVFYLQAQIGIETGEYAAVKRRLVPRVNQHPNDMVALSLLETCIHLEFVEWEKTHPRTDAGPDATGTMEVPASGTLGPLGPSSDPSLDDLFGNVQAAHAASQAAAYNDTPVPAKPSAAGLGRAQFAPPSGTAQDADFGLFQSLANDVNTQAIAFWNPEKGRFKSACRNAGLEPLVAILPHEVPGQIQTVCTALDAGIVNKICFSFQNLTMTSFHSGSENMGIITGNINQSLLSIVRAENTFRKQSSTLAQAASLARSASVAANRNMEPGPNE